MQTYPQKRLNFFLVYYKIFKSCRDGRVVECARLEIVLRGNTYGGSNPLLCAKQSGRQKSSALFALLNTRTSVGLCRRTKRADRPRGPLEGFGGILFSAPDEYDPQF